jgi:hypothetical protein
MIGLFRATLLRRMPCKRMSKMANDVRVGFLRVGSNPGLDPELS